jgi:UDP-glucose 4-epimerase
VLPTILSQLLDGRTRIELGRVDTRRDLTFVGDTAEGFVRAAEAEGVAGDTIQLGTGRAESIQEIFELACKVTGCQAEMVVDPRRVRPDASEVLVLLSDPARARERLGWSARVSLEEGLSRTAEWMRAHQDHYKPGFLHV